MNKYSFYLHLYQRGRELLEAERERRLAAGRLVNYSQLIREAIEKAYGGNLK